MKTSYQKEQAAMLKELKRERARSEFILEILKTMNNFKSKEEPKIKFTDKDKAVCLSRILTGQIVRI